MLRKEHRIVGSFIGTLAKAPRQVQLSGLPLLLSKEEIDLLLAEELVTLVRFKGPSKLHEDYMNKLQLYSQMSYQDQIQIFKEARKQEILNNADKIVEGALKKRKRDADNIVILDDETQKDVVKSQDAEKIIEEQIASIGELPKNQSLTQTFTGE